MEKMISNRVTHFVVWTNTKLHAMKKLLALAAFLPTLGFAQVCNPNGNIVIFSNYDGGILNIDVDVDIPNLKIGVVSYEGVEINLSGTYVNNVTGVEYAGYNSNNNNCGMVINTSITGAPGSATTNIVFNPPVGLSNPNGSSSMVCAYSCNNNSNQGGCNTVDQVEDYFVNLFNGTLYSHAVQYGCWSGSQAMSTSGNCCPANPPLTSVPSSTLPSCYGDCDGTGTVSASGGIPPYSYVWSPGGATTSTVTGLCAGTYNVVVTDNAGGTQLQTVVVMEAPQLGSTDDVDVCSGESYTYPDGTVSNNITANESHVSTMTSVGGCDSLVTTNLNVLMAPDNTVIVNGTLLSAGQSGASYQWVDCNNGNAPIAGETSQAFVPTVSGSYAVEVTYNGCTVMSACNDVNVGVGIVENSFSSELAVQPNPTDGNFSVSLGKVYDDIQVVLTDMSGKVIWNRSFANSSSLDLDILEPTGTYLLTVTSGSEKAVIRLLKK